MITVKLASSTTQRLRRSEWLLALASVSLGLTYLAVPGLMTPEYFTTMLVVAPQRTWGWFAFGVGLVRVIFLIINGHWRASPHLRMAGAALSVMFWSALFVSSLGSFKIVQAVALWPLFALSDFLAVLDAAADARAADDQARAKRHGATDAARGD